MNRKRRQFEYLKKGFHVHYAATNSTNTGKKNLPVIFLKTE